MPMAHLTAQERWFDESDSIETLDLWPELTTNGFRARWFAAEYVLFGMLLGRAADRSHLPPTMSRMQ